MELYIAETVENIVELYSIKDDPVQEVIGCECGEWIQWLVEQRKLKNDRIVTFIAKDENSICGYIVICDEILPPISNVIFILYAYSNINFVENKELFGEIKDWAKEKGATTLMAITKTPELLKRYGFIEDENVQMMMRL